ncbi:hypothetical protein D1BOALGB6SA_7284 [Olavius sp. associated proteobacterium Delta 1]|nr:hypothetical protein D1BOALGB6SA_7284 [Olavius sp. associated proteobacterium Delta 1]
MDSNDILFNQNLEQMIRILKINKLTYLKSLQWTLTGYSTVKNMMKTKIYITAKSSNYNEKFRQ